MNSSRPTAGAFRPLLRLISSLAIAGIAAFGCDDTDLLYVDPLQGAGATDLDAAADGADANPCTACVSDLVRGGNPACTEKAEPCFGDARCEQLFLCVEAAGCLEMDMAGTGGCSMPCTTEVDLQGAGDPAVALAFPLFDCVHVNCDEICGIEPEPE